MTEKIKSNRLWKTHQAKALAQAMGLSDPVAAVRKLAADLLEEAEQNQAPVDLRLVASFRNIADIHLTSISGSAMLLPSEQGFIILLNSSDPLGRRNFSTAHEICHTFFPCKESDNSTSHTVGMFSIQDEEEYLCDIGASALLLPPKLVQDEIEACGCRLDAILQIANRFRSSIEAAAIAWAQSSPWPCAVVFFEEKLKPIELRLEEQMSLPGIEKPSPRPKLRIMHACPSASFPFFLPKNKSVSADGPIYRCITEGQTVGTEKLELCGEERRLHVESILAPYHKSGKIIRRVVSLLKVLPSLNNT